MKDAQPKAINLTDYQVPDFLIEKTDLIFAIEENITTVTATLNLKRNPASTTKNSLVLMGQELDLLSIHIDGQLIDKNNYTQTDETLTISVPNECVLECVTTIKPQENTSLEGLYKSSGLYCTQCEAEGFRKITYYLDRPDVMSVFTTTIIADKTKYPVLLSNGNLIDESTIELPSGEMRHCATWEDPFKKPAYLFALVAGNLQFVEDEFITLSERKVTLRIFVEEKDLDKCDYAMQSLKLAMHWDEQVYGREYDLDIFMIVAVDDFNMGAMENKGLNIFNTSCVLANQQTTTDAAFQRVEGVVAHEYFHNWSGNRVTCRDWFQLSLKEGFTVFRDQNFSADMGSATVKRIENVSFLRTAQFAEDAGPMAHPVQPSSFIEISNFYTLTIYEKGSEIVRMIHSLLGEEKFREGSDLYFSRHDGQAVTINEFVDAMESVSGRDLTQFKYWYTQAGTPTLVVQDHYDAENYTYELTFSQKLPDTPESRGRNKKPHLIPIAMGLVGEAGCLALHPENHSLAEQANNTHWLIELDEKQKTYRFNNVYEKPVPSLLRNFSAPVKIVSNYTREDYLQLIRSDDDGFNRWDAAQQLAVSIIQELMLAFNKQEKTIPDNRLAVGLRAIVTDESLDKSMVALMLALPSEAYLAEISEIIDVEAIHFARDKLRLSIAIALKDELLAIYKQLSNDSVYSPSAESIARRSLKNTALGYLMLLDDKEVHRVCIKQCDSSDNMTDTMVAFRALVHSDFELLKVDKARVLLEFFNKWKDEALVVNQWLSVQASVPHVDSLETVKTLMQHPSFSIKNPNKVRSLIGVFCQNSVSFHQPSGAGYEFLTQQIITLNKMNPQIAARLLAPLTRWKKYAPTQQHLMKQALENVLAIDDLSKDVYEVVSKSLAVDK
ncbi:MAG: aminopeptidase N [Pseudohongiellaceae bacterium]|jgi:aminopeptidase N